MLNEKKIKIQQSIIKELKAENKRLKEELELVETDLEFKEAFKDEEYTTAKELLVDLNKKKTIYEDLINRANLARKEYKQKLTEINELKVKYNKEMKNLLKDIKKGM